MLALSIITKVLMVVRNPFRFLHKALLLLHYRPKSAGKWATWAGLKNGKQRNIVSAPTLWGRDEWELQGGVKVTSREIDVMLDASEYGYL